MIDARDAAMLTGVLVLGGLAVASRLGGSPSVAATATIQHDPQRSERSKRSTLTADRRPAPQLVVASLDDPVVALEAELNRPAAAAEEKPSAKTPATPPRIGATGKLAPPRVGDGLLLEVSFEQSASMLVAHYRVKNLGAEAKFLFTPLGRYDYDDQAWGPDPGRVYSRVHKGTLELSKRLVLIPRNVSVYRPEVPTLTRLGPGAELSETVRIPLPLQLDDPYQEARRAPTRTRKAASSVVFSIGYLGATDPGIGRVPNSDRFQTSYAIARRRQRVVRSKPVRLEMRVL